MKQRCLSVAWLLLCLPGLSQTADPDSIYPPYQDQISALFEHVDLTLVPNRNLREFGIPLVDPLQFGTYLDSNNVTNVDLFGLTYATIYSMATDTNYRLPNPSYYMQRIDQQTEKLPIELLGLFQTYYSIDTNSLNDSLFVRIGDQLYDVAGRTQSPYLKHTTFLMAPIRRLIHSNILRLSYNPALFYNNTGLTISQFYIDFDNGAGYQLINLGNIPAISYETPGLKNVKFRILASDGTEWDSHTVFQMDFEQEKSTIVQTYDEVDYTFVVHSPESYNGVFANATVNISYSCGHTNLQKPFIWVEGFNPTSSSEMLDMSLDYSDAYKRISTPVSTDNPTTISQYMDLEGYDFVMVDFGNSDTYLEANALVIEEVIRQVNALKHANGSNEKNVTMGQSMGGMCLRYALRDMEVKGEDHEASTYVAFDVAHMGVNLPLGGQYGIKHIANINVGFFSGLQVQDFVNLLQQAVHLLDIPSARTMLYYNVPEKWQNGNWVIDPLAASLHDDYYYKQNEVLGMPQNCELISIVNGSLNGIAGKQNFEPGDELIRFQGNSFTAGLMLAQLHFGNFKPNSLFVSSLNQTIAMTALGVNASADIRVYALQDNATGQRIYRGNVIATALFMPVVFTNCQKKVSAKLGIDSAPGAYPGQHPGKSFNIPGLYTFKLNAFCFTPVASTLNDHVGSSSASRFLYPVNSYTDKYAYLSNPSSGFQAYAGVTQAVYEDTIDQWFQNTGHTWFNTQNAPAMVRYLTGIDQLSGINNMAGAVYNFGRLPLGPELELLNPGLIRTTSKITRSLIVSNGSILRVNSGGYIGFAQNTGSLVTNPNGYFRVDLVQKCIDPAPVVVNVYGGSIVEVGDEGGRTGDLHIQNETNLIIGDNSKLEIHPGSRVIVETGGTLTLNYLSNLIIHDEATVIVKPGGTLVYNQNASITTFDDNARILMQGKLSLGQNATFKINRSGINPSGLLIFSGKPKITAESGSSFYFDGIGNYDPVVQVDANTYVAFDDPDIVQVKFTQCSVVMDQHAHMMVARTLLTDHATFQGRDRIDEKLSFRAKNQFYESTFTDLILQGDMYYPSADVVNVSYCTFNTLRTDLQGTTPYHIAVYGKGYNIHDCNFSNLINEASIYSEDLTLTSGVSNCTFTSTIGATAALEDRSNVEIDFYHNTLSNLKEGLIKSTGTLTLSCNTMSDLTYRYITATDGAKVNLSTQNGGGYNSFGVCTDQNYWSHIWLTDADIDMTKGANTFAYNNYHQYFVRGTIPYTCTSTLTCFRDFTLDNFNYVPSAPQSKFNLRSANNIPVTCNNAALYFDPACGSLGSGDGTIDPGGDPSGLLVLSSYYSDIMEQSVRIDNGVQYATEETTLIADSTGNDLNAMDRFHEIFTSSMPASGDNRKFMLDAQEVMKTTVANLVLDSVADVTQNQTNFTEEFGQYANSLNRLSDTIIDTTNYKEQFYIELKKIHLFRLLDNPSKALEIIQNIEACGVDSAEQVILNREKTYAQRVIAAADYDPATDSTFEFKPTGLTEPVANAKDRYYFGSVIVDPSYLTFMTCMNESDKALFANGGKESDGITMNLYPNPASEKINYRISDESHSTGRIQVLQPDGRIVFESSTLTSGQEQSFNVSNWSPGVYQFVYCRSNGTHAQSRFVVK